MNPQLDWKSQEFRAKCVQEMEKILSKNPSTNISARDLENRIFQKATTKEDYVNYVKACLTKVPLANRAHQPGQPSAPGMGAPQQSNQPQMYGGGDMQQQQPPQSAGPPGQMNIMSGQAPSSGQNFGGMMPGYPNQQPPQQQQQQQQQQQPGQMGQFSGQQPGQYVQQQQGQHGGGMMINQMGQPRQMMMPAGGMMAGQQGMIQRQPMQYSQPGQPGMRPGYAEGMQQLRTAMASNMTPELRQQLIMQQQERLRMERASNAMVMRDNPGMMNPGGQQPFNNQPGYPGGMPPRMGGMMPQSGQAAPGQPNQTSLLTQLIQAPVPSSPQFRPSAPAGQGQPGPLSNQPEMMGAIARPPSVMSLPAKSSPMAVTGPPSNQPVLAPSPAPEINPETVQTGSELYKKKLEELQKHKDMIQKMIAKFQNDPERSGQLTRLKGLQSLIYEKQAVPYPVLVKCENIIKNFCGSQMGLGEPLSSSPSDEKTPGSIPGLTPLIGAGAAVDALVRVDRSSLKPVADALSRALSELNDEQFAALCQAWRARMPGSLDDGVVWRSALGQVDEGDDHLHHGESDSDGHAADGSSTMDEKSELAKWQAEIPAQLQREAGQLHQDFHIILDVDMHPDGELIPDEQVLYLCCGLKQTSPNRPLVPPVGVVVPLDYPSTLIDFRQMDVAAYEGSRFLQEAREAMREKFTRLSGSGGCSLVALMNGWRQSVVALQNRG